jgi:acetyltransferase-like isoleucine patch superfamily enzyme
MYRLADRVFRREAALKGVLFEEGAGVQGRPNIQVLQGEIILRRNAVLRSRDFGYHAHIHPVRMLVDAPGALIEIGERSRINGAAIHAKSTITIGRDTYIASGATIIDVDGHAMDPDARARGERDLPLPIRIGDRAWIGLGVLILKGVEIGNDCIVAAGSIVSKSLPPATLCAGQPARPIRSLGTAIP